MDYLVGHGAEKSKLLVGIPLYGQSYRLATSSQTNLGDPATGPGKPGEFTKQPGMLAYYEICDRIKRRGWKEGVGERAKSSATIVSSRMEDNNRQNEFMNFQGRVLTSRISGLVMKIGRACTPKASIS